MPQTQFSIKHDSPIERRVLVIIIAAVVLLSMWGVYQYGVDDGERVKLVYNLKEKELNYRVEALITLNSALVTSNATLERSGKIDRQALQQMDESLKKIKNQFSDLKKELSFYKSLVTPSDIQRGVQIKSFKISSQRVSGMYLANLVLMQSKNNRYVDGKITLEVDGLSSGEVKSISLSELVNSTKGSLKFKFKYFQKFDMDLVLPDDFIPSSVIIKIAPRGKNIKAFEKTYSWAELNT